jgi:tetratricopeptide (TPR) repeat protein
MGKYLPTGNAGRFVSAEASFRRALDLNPDLAMTHKLLAQLEVDLGHAHDAMARLIGRTHVADPELLAGLVSACRYCGLLDASVAAHARAIELDPKIRTSVAHTWFLQTDYARVATVKFSEAPYIVAVSLKELGRGEAALPVLPRSRGQEHDAVSRLMAAARALLEDNAAESIAAIGRLVGSDFRDPEGLFYLSRHLLTSARRRGRSISSPAWWMADSSATRRWPAIRGSTRCGRTPRSCKLLAQAESQHRAALATFEQSGGRRLAKTG